VDTNHPLQFQKRAELAEYELFLNEFRRNARELMKAGQQKKLDTASLAYV
jgi:hypothetical protein